MIFRPAYENCGLNPAKAEFLATCSLASLRPPYFRFKLKISAVSIKLID